MTRRLQHDPAACPVCAATQHAMETRPDVWPSDGHFLGARPDLGKVWCKPLPEGRLRVVAACRECGQWLGAEATDPGAFELDRLVDALQTRLELHVVYNHQAALIARAHEGAKGGDPPMAEQPGLDVEPPAWVVGP